MYDDLAPLVKQHLASAGPNATVSLTGHSLGGSLASILMMLLVYRKVSNAAVVSSKGQTPPQRGEAASLLSS